MPNNKEILNHLTKPIVLIGMMGSGKTTIGRALAGALNLEFHDSDQIIEEKAGLTTSEIFEKYGEEKFRTSEAKTMKELLEASEPKIISTGGGAIIKQQTRQLIKDRGLSIWLDVDIDALYDRISKNQNRPLLQTENPKETLRTLMIARKEFYTQANIHFKLDHNSVSAALNDLLDVLEAYIT